MPPERTGSSLTKCSTPITILDGESAPEKLDFIAMPLYAGGVVPERSSGKMRTERKAMKRGPYLVIWTVPSHW